MRSAHKVKYNTVITSFAGLRATPSTHDFIIGEVKGAPGFIDVGGIESPGLTSAPAIALHVAELVKGCLGKVEAKADFNPVRRPMVHFAHLDSKAKAAWIAKDARYGRMVCRCGKHHRRRDRRCHPPQCRRHHRGRRQAAAASRHGALPG